jgi:ABC-type dipeptide/oligopeptide/nickel transport system permease subunit
MEWWKWLLILNSVAIFFIAVSMRYMADRLDEEILNRPEDLE